MIATKQEMNKDTIKEMGNVILINVFFDFFSNL